LRFALCTRWVWRKENFPQEIVTAVRFLGINPIGFGNMAASTTGKTTLIKIQLHGSG
jgi:hypothetical protein